MSRYTQTNTGNWLIGTVTRNPEAVLVLAAGCALLLRNGRGSPSGTWQRRQPDRDYGRQWQRDEQTGKWREGLSDEQTGHWREGLSSAAEAAKDYASEAGDRMASTASSYASAASRYAEETGRAMSAQASRLSGQPLAVAALGLAAGAALAAFLPPTELEERALGPAREAIAETASKTGENLRQAAGEAGERLKQSAAERGLSPEGVKEMAREATQTFTNTMSGETGNTSSPSMVPGNTEPVRGGAQ